MPSKQEVLVTIKDIDGDKPALADIAELFNCAAQDFDENFGVIAITAHPPHTYCVMTSEKTAEAMKRARPEKLDGIWSNGPA